MSAADFATIREALGLLGSAVKSGEPWTDTCQETFDRGWRALARVEADTLTPEQARFLLAEIRTADQRILPPSIPAFLTLKALLGRIAGGGWSKPTDADIERGQELAKEHRW